MEQQQSQLYLDQVSLTAPFSSLYLLKDISFTVERGDRVAIVVPLELVRRLCYDY